MSTKLQELEERAAQRAAQRAKDEEDQYVVDLEAREQLEDEHGAIAAVKVARFMKGHPTRAYLKTPNAAQYKRYKDQIYRASEKKNSKSAQEAQELLALSCWVYPREDSDRKAMLEVFPGLLSPLSLAAAALAEGNAEDEGKG